VRVEPRAAKHLQVADWTRAAAAGNRAVVTDTGGWSFLRDIVATHLAGDAFVSERRMRVKGESTAAGANRSATLSKARHRASEDSAAQRP